MQSYCILFYVNKCAGGCESATRPAPPSTTPARAYVCLLGATSRLVSSRPASFCLASASTDHARRTRKRAGARRSARAAFLPRV